jgi:hypothetical protein
MQANPDRRCDQDMTEAKFASFAACSMSVWWERRP